MPQGKVRLYRTPQDRGSRLQNKVMPDNTGREARDQPESTENQGADPQLDRSLVGGMRRLLRGPHKGANPHHDADGNEEQVRDQGGSRDESLGRG